MGAVSIKIGDATINAIGYSITEEATPVSGGDTYGAVASFNVTVPQGKLAEAALYQADVRVEDSQYGKIFGHIDKIARNDGAGTFSLTCLARTAKLAVRNVSAPPHRGTLSTALGAYLSLGDATLAWKMPDDMKTLPVAFPGWTGDLWNHLKQLAVAWGLEIAFNDGYVEFRRPRGTTLSVEWSQDLTTDIGDNSLADKAELYWYRTYPISNNSVYPPNRDLEFAQVYSIPAGEETEIVLQLEASVSSVVQPVFRETISPTWFSGSNISLTKEDGNKVTFGEWARGNGAARVEIMDDSTRLKLIVRGPYTPGSATYRLAVAGTNTHGEYSAIRIAGNGVGFTRERVEVLTGVRPNYAASDMAPTQDNIFINNASAAWDLCASHARLYSTATVSATFSAPAVGLKNPLGLVPGGRFYDPKSKQWFRARSVDYEFGLIKVSGDLDTLESDAKKMFQGMTYAQLQQKYQGKTYARMMLDGVEKQ